MKCTTSIAKMKSEFTLKQATSHAGSKPLLAYLEKIQLERVFQIKSKFVCKFPQLERADYIIRVTFDTGFG